MASRNGVVQRGAVKLDRLVNFKTSSFKSQLPHSQSPKSALRRSSPALFGSEDDGVPGRVRLAVRLRPRNAEEMMADIAQTSALRHMAFGLSSWQLLPSLSLGPLEFHRQHALDLPTQALWSCLKASPSGNSSRWNCSKLYAAGERPMLMKANQH